MAQTSGIDIIPDFPTMDLGIFVEIIGLQRIIDCFGLKRVVEEIDLEALVTQLTPEQREDLKRLLG